MIDQSTMLLMATIGTLILLLALFILFHQNMNATKGYQLRRLERERSEFHLEEEILQMQIAAEQALEHLQQEERIQAMLPVKKPLYVDAGNGAVAYDPHDLTSRD